MAWTTPSTWASGDWNLQIRDNMTYMFNNLPPVGSVLPWAGASYPALSTGWLPCDGRSLSTTGTYAALFGIIGYGFGGSGGSFNIPNMAGRSLFGVGWDGTGNSVNHYVNSPGDTGGANYGDHTHSLVSNATATTNSAINTLGGNHDHGFVEGATAHGHGFQVAGNVNRATGNLTASAGGHDHNFGAVNTNHGHSFGIHNGHSHAVTSDTSIGGSTAAVNSGYDTRPPYMGMYFIIRYV